MSYQSTKLIELGSCAFRQWRATSHCSKLHGYQLLAKFYFAASSLDEKNWVVDFASLKTLKAELQNQFDHTLCLAKDDPLIEIFQHLHNMGGCDLRIMDDVGIEKTAEFCFNAASTWLKNNYGGRCWVEKVEVFEHEANSAIYSELKPITYSTSFTTPVPSTYTAPIEAVNVTLTETQLDTSTQEEIKLIDLIPPTTVHPIETPPVQNENKSKAGPVPLHGNGVTNGYSGLFDNISWGSR